MSTLLVSLGTSPAIVPEAFLLPDAKFTAVHVLTTSLVNVQFVQEWFAQRTPGVELTVTRVADFSELKSEADHFQFEEVLYRWWLEKVPAQPPHVCLSGGFKTMSVAMQRAAAVMGAEEVFHVLADNCCTNADGKPRPPANLEEIFAANSTGSLRWIRLGPESGWPQMRAFRVTDYPLLEVRAESGVRWVRAADDKFRIRLQQIVERSHRIAGAWERLPALPFQSLATWSRADLDWLNEPVNPDQDLAWLKTLPKVELHCHLGGFATRGSDLTKVRQAAAWPARLPPLAEPALPAGWPLPISPESLEAYMKLGDANGSSLLKDPGCLRRQCELLYEQLVEQQIGYAEIRCSPANYALDGRSPWTVLAEIKGSFDDCMRAAGHVCHVNLILIATRRKIGDFRAAISRHLALAVSAAEHWTNEIECRVVGVDLAGYEDQETRAHYFREEFTGVHRCGLALTVHAGENDDAEGIWRAAFDLNARRLGHGLHLIGSPELMRSVADRGIGVEMCPYANLQIRGFPLDAVVQQSSAAERYPLLDYLRSGIRVTVNTDNIGISSASLTDNLLLAARLCPELTRLDVLQLQRNALDTAFLPAQRRAEMVKNFSAAIPQP